MIARSISPRFRGVKNVKNQKNIFLNFDPWLRQSAPSDLNFALPRPPLPGGKARSPSLHETHFDGSDFDLPRTVLHHPDPYTTQPLAGATTQPQAGTSTGVQYQPLPYYQQVSIGRVGEDTFEVYLRYRYMRGCIFCIFQILRYRYQQ